MSFFVAAYYLLLLLLAVFGAHRLWLVLSSSALKPTPREVSEPSEWPLVTLQAPIFNEPMVVERVVRSLAQIDYPADRLEIQVLDDSTDETSQIAADLVKELVAQGVDIVHLRRPNRDNYKAGALAEGVKVAKGELIGVFDSDFVPPRDFLKKIVGEFQDSKVGMVQARWGHLNRTESMLTRAQATFLDGHFLVEHAARFQGGRLFNFNGTAGVWRKAAIQDAGGWTGKTLTEDLELSIRVHLRGWKFVLRNDVLCPAELPASFSAFRGQQKRWAQGGVQTAKLLAGKVWRSKMSFLEKLDATLLMAGNLAYTLLIMLVLLMYPVFLAREIHGMSHLAILDAAALFPATGFFWFYLYVSGRRAGRGRAKSTMDAIISLVYGIGLSANNGLAALRGFPRNRTPFFRTPKVGAGSSPKLTQASRRGSLLSVFFPAIIEAALGTILVLLALSAFVYKAWWAIPFSALMALGYFAMAFGSIAEFLTMRFSVKRLS